MKGRRRIHCVLLVVGGLIVAARPHPLRAQNERIDPELDAALQELEDAGVALAPGELADALAPAPSRADRRRELDLRLGGEPTAAESWDPRLHIDSRWSDWRMRGRIRRVPGEPVVRGDLRWERDPLRLRAGDVGLGWGSGLLAAAPGRGAAQTTDAPLVAWRDGPASGGSYGDPRALRGAAWSLAASRWRTWGVIGSATPTASRPLRLRQIAGLGHEGRAMRWGLLVARQDSVLGASLQAGFEQGRWRLETETAGGRRGAATEPWRALQVHLTCSAGRTWRAEAACAAASGGPWLESGRRPALLVDDEGRGWSLRGAGEPVRGLTVAALCARSDGRDPRREGHRARRDRVELQSGWRPAAGWTLQVRWRRTLEQEWAWSERYPWQPPIAGQQARRMIFTASVSRKSGARSWRLLGRTQSDGDGGEVRHRNLLQWVGSVDCMSFLRLRASWAGAWGGDADLVSALTPIRGVLLPRHWGRWRSETALGIEAHGGGLRCSAAVSCRSPEPGPDARDDWWTWVALELDR